MTEDELVERGMAVVNRVLEDFERDFEAQIADDRFRFSVSRHELTLLMSGTALLMHAMRGIPELQRDATALNARVNKLLTLIDSRLQSGAQPLGWRARLEDWLNEDAAREAGR